MTAWDVRWLAECGSTMVEARHLARAGAPQGLVVVADHQTAGRGRLDRRWEAPPGASLMCSVLLRPDAPAHRDTLRVALAAADAVAQLTGGEVAPGLKWPNDLLVDVPGAGERKLAGVLAEAEGDDAGWAVVVGIGLNVDWPPAHQLPEHLAQVVGALSHVVAGPTPDRRALLEAMLRHLDVRLAQDRRALMAEYRERCVTLGRWVRAERKDDRDAEVAGPAVEITQDGALVIDRGASGSHVVLHAGDVVHVRPGERPAAR